MILSKKQAAILAVKTNAKPLAMLDAKELVREHAWAVAKVHVGWGAMAVVLELVLVIVLTKIV